MLEALHMIQPKSKDVPVDDYSGIEFKTSQVSETMAGADFIGEGFVFKGYYIDGVLMETDDTIEIPSGDHIVRLTWEKIVGAESSYLNMNSFSRGLVEVTDWSKFDLSSISFLGCNELIKVPDYLPASITSCKEMFFNCEKFNYPIGSWDVSNVVNMESMFNSAFIFNQPLGNWNVTNVKNIKEMFCYCLEFNQDLSSWIFDSSVESDYYDDEANSWLQEYRPKFIG